VTRAQIYRVIFTLAGLYNIVFGLWAALFPDAFFRLIDLGAPSHPAIWACLGMVIGLYGLVYLQVAFTDPERRRSALAFGGRRVDFDVTRFLIALGLLGKILGPIGFVIAVRHRELPVRMLSLLVFDDMIWWAPFGLYLIDDTAVAAWIRRRAPEICAVVHLAAAVATLVWIRGGSEAVADSSHRAAFIATHTGTWRAGWVLWMIAAVTLVGFCCWWAVRSHKRPLAVAALGVAFAALAADFFADSLFIGWMPDRYTGVARATTFVSEVVANGLYSVAGAMLMFASRMPTTFLFWGWSVWLAGFALAACGAARWDTGIVAASAILLTLFIPWVWLASRRIEDAT
jgi:hypothetical protein